MRQQNESQSSDHVIQNAADAERVVQRQHDDVEILSGCWHVFGQLPIEEFNVNIPIFLIGKFESMGEIHILSTGRYVVGVGQRDSFRHSGCPAREQNERRIFLRVDIGLSDTFALAES